MDEDSKMTSKQLATIGPRIVFGTFGFAFAGIGISVLAFLWLTPFNEFGSPPLFFRIFGSFIALCFVAMGTTTFIVAILAPSRLKVGPTDGRVTKDDVPPKSSGVNYSCPNCGAKLGTKVDVSPLGDVNCQFCHQWFNIHRTPSTGHP